MKIQKILKATLIGMMGLSLGLGTMAEAAPVVIHNVEGFYRMGDDTTHKEAKMGALNDAKRMALEQAGVMVESNTIVRMGKLEADEIKSTAYGLVKLQGDPEYDLLEGGYLYRATITVEVDPDVAKKEIRTVVQQVEPRVDPKKFVDVVPLTNQNDPFARLKTSSFRGHLYKVFNNSMTWVEAMDYCRINGGHLVTIKDEEEQKFVADLVTKNGNKNCYWLGANKDYEGNMHWIDGTDMVYKHWSGAQPDNFCGNECHLMMYRIPNPADSRTKTGYWNDANYTGECNNEIFYGVANFGFVCEWDG